MTLVAQPIGTGGYEAIDEINTVIKGLEGETLTGTAKANKMYSMLKDIVANEETARSNGVDVDAVLELFDVSRSDLKGIKEPKKKNKILQNILGFLKAIAESN